MHPFALAPPVQRAACALPFEGSVPSRINRNHSINQISTRYFKIISLFLKGMSLDFSRQQIFILPRVPPLKFLKPTGILIPAGILVFPCISVMGWQWVNFLQSHSLRLGAREDSPEEMRHKAHAEEREYRRRCPCRRHCRKHEREPRAEGPVREAAEALSLGAEALREYLGYEYPDDNALPEREKNDEREYAERCEKPKIEHERSRRREVRGDSRRKSVIVANANAGTASAPSIHRQALSPMPPSAQFTNCETTMPRTMLN